MAQYAVPDVDVVDGNWTDQAAGTDLHTQIVPGTPGSIGAGDDATYVQSEANPSSNAMAVTLSTIEDPVSSSGHVSRWRHYKSAAGGGTIGVVYTVNENYVNEGTPGDVRWTHTEADISESVATDTDTWSAGEADSITDYADLTLRIVANQT